jgi:AcrR family transcriptional regulator
MSTRRRLIDAAIAALAEHPSGEVSLRDAARRAGISHNAPYNHFQGRNELMIEVAREGHDRLVAALPTRACADPTDWISGMASAYALFAWDNPALYRAMFDRTAAGQDPPLSAALYRRVRPAIAHAHQTGATHGSTVDDNTTAWLLLMHGFASGMTTGHLGRNVSSRERAERLALAVSRSLFPSKGSPAHAPPP